MKVTYSVELLEATINKQIERIEALEAALRDIAFAFEATENAAEKMYFIANAALAPEQDA